MQNRDQIPNRKNEERGRWINLWDRKHSWNWEKGGKKTSQWYREKDRTWTAIASPCNGPHSARCCCDSCYHPCECLHMLFWVTDRILSLNLQCNPYLTLEVPVTLGPRYEPLFSWVPKCLSFLKFSKISNDSWFHAIYTRNTKNIQSCHQGVWI